MAGQEPTEAQKAQYLQQARAQINQQFMQDLMHKVTDQCNTKCAGTSGSGLSSSEKSCMNYCMQRYMDTLGVVQQVLTERR